MRTLLLSIMTIFMAYSFTRAAGPDCCEHWSDGEHNINIHGIFDGYNYGRHDDARLKIDGNDVIITCEKRRYRSDEIKITGDYRLYVNGDRIDLDNEQKNLVKDFYQQAVEIDKEAKVIEKEGKEIGLEGARIGVRAASGALKLLFLDFDEDEFEEKIERQAEKLERKADALDEKAGKLEDLADELEDMQHELSRKIPELDELRWF